MELEKQLSAKLTKYLINKGCKVSLIAGDTYRAAAIEQLKIWAEKKKNRLSFCIQSKNF